MIPQRKIKSWVPFASGLLAILVGITLVTADPQTDTMWGSIAAKIQAQNHNINFDSHLVITHAAKAQYDDLFPERHEYHMLQVNPDVGAWQNGDTWRILANSPKVKGVLFGRPPEPIDGVAKAEPLGLPTFEYELLPTRDPERVRLTFKTAAGVEFAKFEVDAAVITPATAMAIDGRLTMFTDTPAGAVVHPALEGHRLAFRPAVADGFPFAGNGLSQLRLSEQTLAIIDKARDGKPAHPNTILWERPWALNEEGFKLPKLDGDPANSILQFAVRDQANLASPLEVSDQLNKEVFASLTETEKQLLAELQETVLVSRIVYGARNGWIINFDKERNWEKMIDDLAPIYKANLNPKIDSPLMKWFSDYWNKSYNGDKNAKQLLTFDLSNNGGTVDFNLK